MPAKAPEAPTETAVREGAPENLPAAPSKKKGRARPEPDGGGEGQGAGEERQPMPALEHSALLVEAALLASDRPVSAAKLADAMRLPAGGANHVREAIDHLNETYERTGRSFRIEQVAGGFRALTLPQYSGAADALREARESTRLSRAAVETLAVIAYRQPITRAEIEAIRGVACGEVLGSLLERRLIAITGRAEEVGRPMLYGTSRAFLETFGLASIKDLPSVGDFGALERFAEEERGAAHAPPTADAADSPAPAQGEHDHG